MGSVVLRLRMLPPGRRQILCSYRVCLEDGIAQHQSLMILRLGRQRQQDNQILDGFPRHHSACVCLV